MSAVGIVLTAGSLVLMPLLGRAKHRLGGRETWRGEACCARARGCG